jgi:hypothetical protein
VFLSSFRFAKWYLCSRFPPQIPFFEFLLSIHGTCPFYHVLCDFITWIIFGEYILWSSPLCSFHDRPVTSSLLVSDIFLSTLFLNTLSLCSFLNVRDSVDSPTKQQATLYSDKHDSCL